MHARLAMIVRTLSNHGTDGGPVPGQPIPPVTPIPSTHARLRSTRNTSTMADMTPQGTRNSQHQTWRQAIEDDRGSGRVPRNDSGSRTPLHLGRLDGRRLGGCRRHTGRNHDTRTPSRLCRTGWVPALSYTRRAILVTLGVAPAFVKPAPQQQDVREREHRHALVVGANGFEAAAFDP